MMITITIPRTDGKWLTGVPLQPHSVYKAATAAAAYDDDDDDDDEEPIMYCHSTERIKNVL